MAAKPLRTIRKRASAERCLRSLGATSAMVPPDRKTAHRFVRGGLWHRCLRKDQLESPEFTGFYLPPGIAGLHEQSRSHRKAKIRIAVCWSSLRYRAFQKKDSSTII